MFRMGATKEGKEGPKRSFIYRFSEFEYTSGKRCRGQEKMEVEDPLW